MSQFAWLAIAIAISFGAVCNINSACDPTFVCFLWSHVNSATSDWWQVLSTKATSRRTRELQLNTWFRTSSKHLL